MARVIFKLVGYGYSSFKSGRVRLECILKL